MKGITLSVTDNSGAPTKGSHGEWSKEGGSANGRASNDLLGNGRSNGTNGTNGKNGTH
jgi:hypothetical protein